MIFKPRDARDRHRKTKFDPKGLYGILAGYAIEPGNKWSRRMLVWNLHDFAKANLAFDCENVPMRLQRPHVTEGVELELPITFQMKNEYEKLNGTLEGMNVITDRDRRPDVDDMIDGEPDDEEPDYAPEPLWDEDQDDDDGGDDPPLPGEEHRGVNLNPLNILSIILSIIRMVRPVTASYTTMMKGIG